MSAPETVVASFASSAGTTIQTTPPGLQFSVDVGALQTSPQTLNLPAGAHTIAVATTHTRGATGAFGGPSMAGGATRSVPVPLSTCNIPATAQAYSLNITVVPPASLTYLSIWPTGQAQPVVSTLNSLDGRIVANAAIVPAGTAGAVSLFVSNATDVILDTNAYFAQ